MSTHAKKQSRELDSGAVVQAHTGIAGKRTLVEEAFAPVVQQHGGNGEQTEAQVHAAAAQGVRTPSSPLPFGNTIQRAFGRHDISGLQAHAGGGAAESARAMGADAYATGNHVVLGSDASLHTVAHEAAHVVQQRAGVSLKGGVGKQGDAYEQHADAVADAVVAGRSAEPLLDQHAGAAPAVQTKAAVQLRNAKAETTYGATPLDSKFTDAHIYQGEVDGTEPKGLHAYSGGVAGVSVTVLKTLGNVNSVHVIIWTKGAARGARKAKWSTMFPQGMSKGISAWYINSGPGAVDGEGNDKGKIGTGWATIQVNHAGDTAYPVGGPSWKETCEFDDRSQSWSYDHNGTKYKITNP